VLFPMLLIVGRGGFTTIINKTQELRVRLMGDPRGEKLNNPLQLVILEVLGRTSSSSAVDSGNNKTQTRWNPTCFPEISLGRGVKGRGDESALDQPLINY